MKNLSVTEMGARAKKASRELLSLGNKKTQALFAAADELRKNAIVIIEENKKDIANAKDNGISDTMVDRLLLNEERIEGMAKAIEEVASYSDPIGRVLDGETRPNGLKIEKVTVPMGVIGIIYESRPNVTSDAAALCIKAGNAVILRGGKEAINSNIAISDTLRKAFKNAGIPEDILQLIHDTTRKSSNELMELTDYLDLLIPRGGAGLIRAVKENSRVPVIETGVGNCHVYVDEFADLAMADEIVYNAKTSRPSVCNAIETVLVHESVAEKFLPVMQKSLSKMNVEIKADEKAANIISGTTPATEEDYKTEFLDFVLAVKVVSSLSEAVEHISKYSSGHSEAIITKDIERAESFTQSVDSAAVYVNSSTRFTDGGEFGLGAEIGISTQKLHARGPMGLNELTSYKYIIKGTGNIR